MAFAENPQHPAQRFGGTPEPLVADGEQAEILRTQFQFVNAGQPARYLPNCRTPALGFFIEHFVKDMGIAADESAQLGLDLPGLKLVLGMYQKLADEGHGRLGTQALIKAFEG